MQTREFSYSLYFRAGNIFLSFLMVFVAGQFGILLFRTISASINGIQVPAESLIVLSAIFLMMLMNVVIYLNWQPDFILQENGIVVKVFHFWERLIPWDDVLEVKRSWIPITGSRLAVVVVERLTPLHRILGLVYGPTPKPVFVITHALRDREEAAQLITSRVSRNFPLQNEKPIQ